MEFSVIVYVDNEDVLVMLHVGRTRCKGRGGEICQVVEKYVEGKLHR